METKSRIFIHIDLYHTPPHHFFDPSEGCYFHKPL
jgi:hypothetical protein